VVVRHPGEAGNGIHHLARAGFQAVDGGHHLSGAAFVLFGNDRQAADFVAELLALGALGVAEGLYVVREQLDCAVKGFVAICESLESPVYVHRSFQYNVNVLNGRSARKGDSEKVNQRSCLM
jgi:hypothetical protein